MPVTRIGSDTRVNPAMLNETSFQHVAWNTDGAALTGALPGPKAVAMGASSSEPAPLSGFLEEAPAAQPFSNLQPSLALNQLMPLTGVYPQRDGPAGFSEGFQMGQLRTFGGNFSFADNSFANGATLNIAQHTALFSLFGTTYGGNGQTTFRLPDLGGSLAVGAGQGPGLSDFQLGQEFGSGTITLTSAQMPAAAGGSGQAIDNAQESLALNWIISVDGLFPTPNSGVNADMMGMLSQWGGNFEPSGFMFADGRELQISEWTTLFALIGTTYGGDGQTTFRIPDLRGRVPVGADANSPVGTVTGSEGFTLTTANLPVGAGGSGVPISNLQPTLAVKYLIVTEGIFPSRDSSASSDQLYLGEVIAFAGDFVPRGFAEASGQLLSIAQNTALFSILGTTYGGNGQTNFALPNLNDRAVIGAGGIVTLGEVNGSTETSLIGANIINVAPDILDLQTTDTGTEQVYGRLDEAVDIRDFNLDGRNGGAGDYVGATLAISREGGANVEDAFRIDATDGTFTIVGTDAGGQLQSGGLTFATYAQADGVLTITFTSAQTSATSALVDAVASGIAYANQSDTPPASVPLGYTFRDGNTGAQGVGGAGVHVGMTTVTVTPTSDAPTQTGLAASVTFAENLVNATPQLLDADVTFTGPDGNLDGGTVTLSGLLAEDRASVRNEGTGAGQIGLNGSNVTFAGATIGVLAGGSGTTLTITLNAAATSTAVDALIQNLTYANVSDTPAASRDLVLNITDATGNDLGSSGQISFTERSGASNPFNTLDVGSRSTPTLADLDGDGDLDAVIGENFGSVTYLENTGTDETAVFTQRFGAANPFNSVFVGSLVTPTLADLDGDGDLDAVFGELDGFVNYYQNTGTASAPVFTARTGGANPFNAIDVGYRSSPAFADLDGDGDLDVMIGDSFGTLRYFQNTGTSAAPIFANVSSLLINSDVGNSGSVTFNDLDGDGDLDALAGYYGGLRYFENTGSVSAPAFTLRLFGTPFVGINVGSYSTPTFADMDGDGDVDLVVGELDGNLNYFENTTPRGQTITVNVTAENDAPISSGLPTDVTVTEDVGVVLDLSSVSLSDPDSTGFFTMQLQATGGTLTASTGGAVTVSGSGTGLLTLYGGLSALDAFLNGSIFYTSALNATGDNAASVLVTLSDGTTGSNVGTFNVDIAAVNDAPVNTVPGAQTLNEDGSVTLSSGNGNAISVADVDATTLTVTLSAANGELTLASTAGLIFSVGDGTADTTLTFSGSAAAINAALGAGLTYMPDADFSGPDEISVVTSDGTGGTDSDSIAITVNAVNDEPQGLDASFTINEDGSRVFAAADFGFSDAVDGDAFAGIVITTLPANGVLLLNGAPITIAGTFVNAAEIAAQQLVFQSDANENGENYATFTFQVRDDGGIANGGQDTDQSPNTISFDVTAVNDAPVISVPGEQAIDEDGSFTLSTGNGNAVRVADVDGTNQTVTLSVAHGTLTIASTLGLSFSVGDGTADTTLTFTGTAAAINAALGAGLTYNPDADYNGADAISVVSSDGAGGTDSDSITIGIAAVNDAPTLTGFATAVTFDENLVNATPQLLDTNVTFADVEGNFDGGTLTLSGLLAEDRASVRNEGADEGEIGLSGADVTFGGVTIGTLEGGSGATLTITLNAAATSAAVDALVQNLTYANVSDTPTATRDLVLNITDAAGDSLAGVGGAPTFADQTGAANPLNGVAVASGAAPSFADLDGDDDLDVLVGNVQGTLSYFENTGTASAAAFTARTGTANPFNDVEVFFWAAPVFGDLDSDGDFDAIIAEDSGAINYFENTGTSLAPVFTEQTGAANPLNGATAGQLGKIALADLDGDGDLDAVLGRYDGFLNYLENTGTTTAPVFVLRSGPANPFNGIDIGTRSSPAFTDVDGDGDLDAIIGTSDSLTYFENTGTASSATYVQRTGPANPLAAASGSTLVPTFADLDGDGDADLVVGRDSSATILYQSNTTPRGQTITVNVTAQADAPEATGVPTDVTVTEDVASDLNLSAVTLTNADGGATLTVVLTASAGTLTAASGGSVTVTNSGTGAITLSGTAASIDAFLNTASNIRYTGALNANGNDAATVTITADNGSGAVTLGVVNVDITAVNDIPTAPGLPTDLAVTEGETLSGNVPVATDVDGAIASYQLSGMNPAGLTLNPDGTFSFSTAAYQSLAQGQTQDLVFTYTATDNDGGVSAPQTLTITVTGISGTAANDTVRGTAGNDVLNGGSGSDNIFGGSGDDTFIGGMDGVGDTFRGEGGNDTVDYSGVTGGMNINLANSAYSVATGSDQLFGIENAVGTAFADTISGNTLDNRLTGGLGNDTLNGNAGIDTAVINADAANGIAVQGASRITVTTADGVDLLRNIEFIEFDNAVIQVNGATGNAFAHGVDDADAAAEDGGAVVGNVLANDIEIEGEAIQVASARAGSEGAGGIMTTLSGATMITGAHGVLTINTDGSYSYLVTDDTLSAGDEAFDLFTYRVVDGAGEGSTAQITFTVTGAELAPAPVWAAPKGSSPEVLPALVDDAFFGTLDDSGPLVLPASPLGEMALRDDIQLLPDAMLELLQDGAEAPLVHPNDHDWM